MNHPDPTAAHAASNRDFGAREYEATQSPADPGAEPLAPDSSLDGQPQQAEGRALRDAAHRALARRPGPRTGIRPDYLILEEINERLTHDELIDAGDMQARCNEGHVVLTGSVPQRWMKHRAEDIADAVRGVASVENRLSVSGVPANAGHGDAPRGVHTSVGSDFIPQR